MPGRATMLSRYVSLATLKAFALAAAALTGLLSLLELVEQLASVGQGRYRLTDAFVYVLLTAPGRFLQVTPMAMLLGAPAGARRTGAQFRAGG